MKETQNTILMYFSEHLNSSFEFADLELAVKKFEKIVLFTNKKKQLPVYLKNIDVVELNDNKYQFSAKYLFNIILFKILIVELFTCKNYLQAPSFIKSSISKLFRAYYKSQIIIDSYKKQKVESNSKTILFQTFWSADYALSLAVFKLYYPEIEFSTRIHGVDLYEERIPNFNKIEFRKFVFKQVTKVFSVSYAGLSYLISKYPRYRQKFFLNYLGSKQPLIKLNSLNQSNTFVLVSCATIRNIKRIYLIAQMLNDASFDFNIRWIHLGGRNEMDETLDLLDKNLDALKSNSKIEYEFLGELSNEEIHQFYQKNTVNCFISVSKTEGLPVSMIEALSYGIPIISTNVGGCSEIVTEKTGILIPQNFSLLQFENAVKDLKLKNWSQNEIINFWESKFNSEKNYEKFLKLVLN